MEVKCLEVRDAGTFIPVICIRPVAENGRQLYLLRRDGYNATDFENCIIVVKGQCRGAAYDPFDWNDRTMKTAHLWIEEHWDTLQDGDVVDVEHILGESATPKVSERA